MIEKFRLNRFCCCCTIRTGSLVIGVFGWIGSLLNSITLSTPRETKTTITESDEGKMVIEEEDTSTNYSAIFISIFMFLVSVSLVVGIYKDNRKFILPWLVIKFIECCVLTIAALILFFLLFISESVGILVIIFFIIGGFTGLFWYCWCCVWSLYMDMGESTLTIVPVGQSIPMTEPAPPPYPSEKPMSPPQEMV